MNPSELIAALIDARLFGLQHEDHIAGLLASMGVNIRLASEIESEVADGRA